MTIRYFIPDWDDRVDPDYDFLTDSHTLNRDPYTDDRYAHELYEAAPYDGVLLSRAVLDANKRKREAILEAGSVHRYLRLPADDANVVIGDCGAFTYWEQALPPYQTEEVLAYYQDLGFDLGVSIDHLIFAERAAEKERRWHITLNNAEEFLRLHRARRYRFTPIGVAQGWDPPSYQRAAHALVQMGYEYIAIGGLVRNRTSDVVKTLAAIKSVLPPHIQVHLFGVNRPEFVQEFASLGVTSFDSASRLRRAWMDGRRNYFLADTSYTAIRIPEARVLARKLGCTEGEARTLEQAALESLRAFDHGQAALQETHAAVSAYATFAGDQLRRIQHEYLQTLKDRPWNRCPCKICHTIGIEVIIFRGNNRNRRRGFHNTWQLYQQLHAEDTKPDPEPRSDRTCSMSGVTQMELDF